MRQLITPPILATPSPYGLTSVAAITDSTDDRWRAGVEWQRVCPADGATTYETCYAAGPAASGSPTPFTPTNTQATYGATAFTVFAELDCSAPGFWDQAQDLAASALAAAEPYQIERAFWTGNVGGVAGASLPHLAANAQLVDGGALLQQAATSVTTTATAPASALGALEAALARCVKGGGVIHVPDALIPVLSNARLVTLAGGQLRTYNGNPVVAGAGYPGTGPDGTGTTWIYATGPVWGFRGPIRVFPPPSTLDRTVNTVHAIAQRAVLLAYDCCLLAAQISTS